MAIKSQGTNKLGYKTRQKLKELMAVNLKVSSYPMPFIHRLRHQLS